MLQELKYKDHDEWLAIRKKYIGGSDAGAVIGMNPWRSAYAVWAEKTGRVEGFAGNLTTEVGSYLEELVATLFTRETGKKVRRKNATLVNDRYPFACANLDRVVVGEDAFLEIKTTNSLPVMRSLKTAGEEFPDVYYAQCVHYLAVTGMQKCYLAVLVNNRELKIYSMERDEDEIDALMEAERQFWLHVESDTEPPVDGSESCAETIAALHPEDNGATVSLMGLETRLDAYYELGQRIKALKDEQGRIANELKGALGDAAYGETDGWKVSWTSSTRSTFDKEAFQKAYRIDLAPFYKTSVSRTMRVNRRAANA